MFQKRSLAITLAALAALSMSACTDLSSVKGVLGAAFQAVQKGNVKALRATMTGDAYGNYANRSGIAELQRKFAGVELGLGATKMTNQVFWPNGGGAGYSEFEVEITRKTQEIPLAVTFMRAEVRCSYSLIDDPVMQPAEGGDDMNHGSAGGLASYCQIFNID